MAAAALCVPLAGKEPEEFLLGAGFHFGSHTGDIEANLDIASRIGLNAGRDERLWNAVEWNKGEYIYGNFVEKAYTQAARRGLAMIFILAYGNRTTTTATTRSGRKPPRRSAGSPNTRRVTS